MNKEIENNSKFVPSQLLSTAVLFIVFNRLDTAKEVFDEIRKAKPPRLYVAADGPRKFKKGERRIVREVRDFVMSHVDWDCEVKTLFRDKNLGCKYAVSSAIDWFFENEEMGIVLEDDCIPSQSFFWFCEELLERYKDDMRIWHIGGTNPISNDLISNDYYFSKYNRIWGWASWRRAWQYFDVDIKFWPEIKEKKVIYGLLEKKEAQMFETIFDDVYRGKIDTWDYQWFLARLLNAHAIIPAVNLVSNIGFSEGATHTLDSNNPLANLRRNEINFPLAKKRMVFVDFEKDFQWSKVITKKRLLIGNVLKRLKK